MPARGVLAGAAATCARPSRALPGARRRTPGGARSGARTRARRAVWTLHSRERQTVRTSLIKICMPRRHAGKSKVEPLMRAAHRVAPDAVCSLAEPSPLQASRSAACATLVLPQTDVGAAAGAAGGVAVMRRTPQTLPALGAARPAGGCGASRVYFVGARVGPRLGREDRVAPPRHHNHASRTALHTGETLHFMFQEAHAAGWIV